MSQDYPTAHDLETLQRHLQRAVQDESGRRIKAENELAKERVGRAELLHRLAEIKSDVEQLVNCMDDLRHDMQQLQQSVGQLIGRKEMSQVDPESGVNLSEVPEL